MAQTFTCVLLLLSLGSAFGKYVYIKELKNWHEAQEYCRLVHTDLAPVSNSNDSLRLQQLVDKFNRGFWIGLIRNCTDCEWTWSGGGAVSTFFWAIGQPENRPNEDYGQIREDMWHDARPHHQVPSLCYSAVVVRERKTWEEALDHCREHHSDLASVASDTDMLLIQKELSKNYTTARVWIGLHYFPGGWLWVDGQLLEYEAWGQEGRPECPGVQLYCAALQVTGGMQRNNGTNPQTNNVTDVGESVWKAHDCVERLHLICY